MDLTIKLNQKFKSGSNLNKKDNLPHITLAMGVIDDSQIPEVMEKLNEISKILKPLDLEISKIHSIVKPSGEKSFSFLIKKSEELKKLQQLIMKTLLPIFTYDVKPPMFNQDQEIDSDSIYWVETFAKIHRNIENYTPHISIKCKKEVVFEGLPLFFKGSQLGLCHLGAHGTCRKILGKVNLEHIL